MYDDDIMTDSESNLDSSDKTYVFMSAGSVEYSEAEAELSIDELIEALEEAKEEGATHVVGLSGNYRGAQYVRLSLPSMDGEEW